MRRVPLAYSDGDPVETVAQAIAELNRLRTQRSDDALPKLGRTPTFAEYADAYVTGINERRYSDSFALLSPDNPTAKKGVQAWIDAESSTQIRDARLRSVSDGPTGSVNAEMTFTSTQSAELGPNGQTCTQWDLVYTMVGPGPDWRIRLASSRSDPVAC